MACVNFATGLGKAPPARLQFIVDSIQHFSSQLIHLQSQGRRPLRQHEQPCSWGQVQGRPLANKIQLVYVKRIVIRRAELRKGRLNQRKPDRNTLTALESKPQGWMSFAFLGGPALASMLWFHPKHGTYQLLKAPNGTEGYQSAQVPAYCSSFEGVPCSVCCCSTTDLCPQSNGAACLQTGVQVLRLVELRKGPSAAGGAEAQPKARSRIQTCKQPLHAPSNQNNRSLNN